MIEGNCCSIELGLYESTVRYTFETPPGPLWIQEWSPTDVIPWSLVCECEEDK
jgi:hypothetical protein